MRTLALLRLYQPTDSFATRTTSLADYERGCLRWGEEVAHSEAGELAGLQVLPELLGEEVAWQGLLEAEAPLGGPLDDVLLAYLLEEALGRLRGLTVDGVVVSLHGATAAVSEPDVAGQVLSRVRETVGPHVPVVATLHLQANVTDRMLRSAAVLVGNKTLPVTDQVGTGRRAAQVMVDLLKVGAQPTVAAWKLPMITSTEDFATSSGPLDFLWEHLVGAEEMPGMLSVGLFQALSTLDAPEMGWTLYQACLCDRPALDERAVARFCWEARQDLGPAQLPYQQVSRPVYPLDDLEHPALAPWAGDMVNRCQCSCSCSKCDEGETESGCGGCGGCGAKDTCELSE